MILAVKECMKPTPLLDTIHSPADLRRLDENQLPQLVAELREFLLFSVCETGGHFASNLGAVELTVALHYVYHTPEDKLVWDVGHQSYPHKILTGRRSRMNTIRQYGGLAGFPKRAESEYDAFGVGHSSTSIGAALGMAVADKLSGSLNRSVAIIGDGAMTAGQAFEALNHAGDLDVNLLVVLNDNEMSISPNVGALKSSMSQAVARDVRQFVRDIKEHSKKVLDHLPGGSDVRQMASRAESKLKSLAEETFAPPLPSLFNNFGFAYTGPVDGHNVIKLVRILKEMRERGGPQLLHVLTTKGQGYKLAEQDPVGFHAIGKCDPALGPVLAKASGKPTYTQIFGQWIIDQASADERLVGITPAMREGSGLVAFEQQFPERYFDVAIAEQHAVTFAAGLACEGKKPVVAIYSTFLQRAYDQLIHDVALQNLPVLFAIDRAGIVGADGPTHAGAYDLSYLRCVPNLTIAAPSDEAECRLLLSTCYRLDSPTAVRYPRGSGVGRLPESSLETVPVGKGLVRREGSRIGIFAFGSMVQAALGAAEMLDAAVADMRFVKPLDEDLVLDFAARFEILVSVEENSVAGGAGSAIAECLAKHRIAKPVLILGIPDTVTGHGDPNRILSDIGLDVSGIEKAVQAWAKDLA